eukprot:TRINITY_DN21901_c0_g1_i2.p1 TRINITY_DN21901_c0_g1~~TRINITY_DN21901_c0_g1_i2.p1  ORF type:complete len:338 (-),score=82.95 TRINITY_DN21901_c0_g1_i2:130-1143(-)
MLRTASRATDEALAISSNDEKAWYRKSCVLEAMGQEEESRIAIQKAGLTPPPKLSSTNTKVSQQAAKPVRSVTADTANAASNEMELNPALESLFGDMVFIEMGVDSLTAVALIMHIQAEIPETPIALTLIYNHPTVSEAVTQLLNRISAGKDDFLRRRMTCTVWRAVCSVLKEDPLKARRGSVVKPQPYPEEEAFEILSNLQKLYEEDSWVQTCKAVARAANFEQQSFLLNLRPRALEIQKPVLEALGYEPTLEGLQKLEASMVQCARRSKKIEAKLLDVRIALQGGANGMWAINVEDDDAGQQFDVNGMESRARYTKVDPFGPGRVNTNSVFVHAC